LALPAARKYASIAPASAHAQHMPSHIFVRLGLWDESIQSNQVSISSAQCYAEKANIKGHWDEELHGLDYLVYAYLQKGADDLSKQHVEYLQTIEDVSPLNFKTAYAFAAIPARYFLERKMWKEAANLEAHPANFPWDKFQWQKAIIHFTRLLGSVHTGNLEKAKKELENLNYLHDTLEKQKDKKIEAMHVAVQIKTSEAWIQLKQGNNDKALELMTNAANLEDGMEKHPVTPGEVLPARELLAEMLLQLNKPDLALEAFELNLISHANRLNSLYGAGVAAQVGGDKEKAKEYFNKLLKITDPNSKRRELQKLASFRMD
jgi:tetratricopeptide (TPR) repeat protein